MQGHSLDYLLKKVGSKYELAVASAKRARKIIDEGKLPKDAGRKAVTMALEEMTQGKVKIDREEKRKISSE